MTLWTLTFSLCWFLVLLDFTILRKKSNLKCGIVGEKNGEGYNEILDLMYKSCSVSKGLLVQIP
jgi:hypothetical protein